MKLFVAFNKSKSNFIYVVTVLILTSACGPSGTESKKQDESEIIEIKEELDNDFEEIMSAYYLDIDELESLTAYRQIKSKVRSSKPEISEYAQVYIDSVAALKNAVYDMKYGSLIEYAKKEGWDNLSKDHFLEVENSLKVKGDEFSTSVLYRHPSSPKFVNYNGFFLYYSKNNESSNKATLSLRAQYRADDWLFCESAKVSIDGEVYTTDLYDWDKDNNGGSIFEWSTDRNPSFNLLIKILESKSSKIRYNGDQYYGDRLISSSQKTALKEVIKAYYGLYFKE